MHLAQLNIGRMLAPMDSPIMADFKNNLDMINALAEKSPGFIWRLKDETNNATEIKIFDDDFLIVNMSVWENIESLFDFVYNTMHKDFLARKKEWFERMKESYMVMWYIEPGTEPTTDDAKERLDYLREHGETPYAFTFRKRFTPEDLAQYHK